MALSAAIRRRVKAIADDWATAEHPMRDDLVEQIMMILPRSVAFTPSGLKSLERYAQAQAKKMRRGG